MSSVDAENPRTVARLPLPTEGLRLVVLLVLVGAPRIAALLTLV